MVFQALLAADDIRLQLGQAGFGPVGFAEILGALLVVVVHVGADGGKISVSDELRMEKIK